jgi:hypothetical protein
MAARLNVGVAQMLLRNALFIAKCNGPSLGAFRLPLALRPAMAES